MMCVLEAKFVKQIKTKAVNANENPDLFSQEVRFFCLALCRHDLFIRIYICIILYLFWPCRDRAKQTAQTQKQRREIQSS